MNLVWSRFINTINIDGVDGDADEPLSLGTSVVGSVQQRNENLFSQELEQMRKESRFSLC